MAREPEIIIIIITTTELEGPCFTYKFNQMLALQGAFKRLLVRFRRAERRAEPVSLRKKLPLECLIKRR